MMFYRKYSLLLVSIALLFSACKSSEFSGYSYDPEGVTDTADREIDMQHKRTIGFLKDGVWFSNEFTGARVSNVYRLDQRHYKLIIDPEINPVNSSSWYSFRVWSDQPASITVELEYPYGSQRYIPKISSDGGNSWKAADSTTYNIDNSTGNGIVHLELDTDTLWVTAQEILTTKDLNQWLTEMAQKPFIQQQTAGTSHQGRPIQLLKITKQSEQPVKGVVIVYGRQHPPEITGYMLSQHFLEILAGDSQLARDFRKYFDVWAFPMMNPDGVDNGHWRTNAAGVDLNRDWQHFNQPETAAVRNALLPLLDRADRKVFYGVDFHSTSYNVMYPIFREIDTFPLHFTYNWADQIMEEMPELELRVEPFDIDSPIAKNWTYKTFGVDAVTFEVGDETPRDLLKLLSVRAAEIFMRGMIEEFKKEFRESVEVTIH
ncbi:MAG: M14 family metallopeptidase [Balneolaceae bacterium]